jgi:hypothetical protein
MATAPHQTEEEKTGMRKRSETFKKLIIMTQHWHDQVPDEAEAAPRELIAAWNALIQTNYLIRMFAGLDEADSECAERLTETLQEIIGNVHPSERDTLDLDIEIIFGLAIKHMHDEHGFVV